MKIAPTQAAELAIAGALLIGLIYVARKVLPAVGEAVNPISRENIAYKSVNAVGGAIVSDPYGPGKNADGSWSLGGWIYDMTHTDAAKEATKTTSVYNSTALNAAMSRDALISEQGINFRYF